MWNDSPRHTARWAKNESIINTFLSIVMNKSILVFCQYLETEVVRKSRSWRSITWSRNFWENGGKPGPRNGQKPSEKFLMVSVTNGQKAK